MTRQIVRFSYLQNTKLVVILYFLFSLIYVPIGIFLTLFGPADQRAGAVVFIFMPIPVAIVTAIITPIGIAVYNGLASALGGFEYTSVEAPGVPDRS